MKTAPKSISFRIMQILVIICCFCSVASQSAGISDSLKTVLTYIPWILLALYMVVTTNRVYLYDFKVFIIPICFFALFYVAKLIGFSYWEKVNRALLIDCFVLLVALLIGKNMDRDDFITVLNFYCIAVVLYAGITYINVFRGVSIYDADTVGLEGGKNSMPMIILSGIVLMLYNKKIMPVVKWIFMPFMAFLIIMVRSRTSMVCCVVAIILRIFIGGMRVRAKIIYTALIVGVVVLLFTNDYLYDSIINRIFLKGHELNAENLNKITSSRTGLIEKYFPQSFRENWFIGISGDSVHYFENFYVNCLFHYGIFGSIPLFLFVLSPLYYCYKMRWIKEDGDLRRNIIMLALVFLFNGLGEALTPLGPGMKCFILWFVFGYYIGYRNRQNELARYERASAQSTQKNYYENA